MTLCSNTDELEIFETATLQEVIDYKWKKYGKKWHLAGCLMHFIYISVITVYVNKVFVEQDIEDKNYYLTIMSLGIIYPLVYDSIQLKRLGYKVYFSEFWNCSDFAFIWLGFFNIFVQAFLSRSGKSQLDVAENEEDRGHLFS